MRNQKPLSQSQPKDRNEPQPPPEPGPRARVHHWLVAELNFRTRRNVKDFVFKVLMALSVLIVVTPFFLVILQVAGVGLADILAQGFGFIATTPGPGLTGGILNAILGTGCLVAIAGSVGVPVSVLGAVYVNEYSKPGLLRQIVEFSSDVLAGIPSIVFGAFGFTFLVVYLRIGIGMVAGGLTLAFMMIPTILRTTQEALRQVPMSLREASLALGATKWSTTWRVTIRSAFPGIVTGVLLALGRVMGETAPLIFTSGNNISTPTSVVGPGSWVASMPYTIWAYISDPRAYLQARAHSTAIALLAMVLVVDLAANLVSRRVTRRLV